MTANIISELDIPTHGADRPRLVMLRCAMLLILMKLDNDVPRYGTMILTTNLTHSVKPPHTNGSQRPTDFAPKHHKPCLLQYVSIHNIQWMSSASLEDEGI